MQNRTTVMEQLSNRLDVIENYIRELGDVGELKDRISDLEENIFTTKRVLTFAEACIYLGVSESHLYKLTAQQEVPHFKPRGKLIYFERIELENWLLSRKVPTMKEQMEAAIEKSSKSKKPRYGRKKNDKT